MQVESVLKRLDHASPRDLQRTLATLNKQLDYMERGSEAWNAHVRKIQAVKNEIAKVNGELAKSQTLLERFNAKWQEWQSGKNGKQLPWAVWLLLPAPSSLARKPCRCMPKWSKKWHPSASTPV